MIKRKFCSREGWVWFTFPITRDIQLVFTAHSLFARWTVNIQH